MANLSIDSLPMQETIREMVHRIAAQFHPDKIILLESHARGDGRPDSDVDLLVVLPVTGSKCRKASEIDLALADWKLPPRSSCRDPGRIGTMAQASRIGRVPCGPGGTNSL